MAKSTDNTGWMGWIGFAGFMLMLGGFFSLIAGFAALFKDTVVYQAATNSVWVLTYSQWGWIHIIAGLLAIMAAGSLFSGHMYGRIIAVTVALLSAVANMAFVPTYPFWSLLVVTVDILIIFAVVVHGGALKEN